jgi:SpoVK/Ycf46/Vps4 family AAA+-type ATPase
MDSIDQAALRRFTFKIQFRPLTAAQRERMFVVEALAGDEAALSTVFRQRLAQLTHLCPGDFAAVQRQVEILAEPLAPAEFLAQLEAEHRIKPEVREARHIGFTAG